MSGRRRRRRDSRSCSCQSDGSGLQLGASLGRAAPDDSADRQQGDALLGNQRRVRFVGIGPCQWRRSTLRLADRIGGEPLACTHTTTVSPWGAGSHASLRRHVDWLPANELSRAHTLPWVGR